MGIVGFGLLLYEYTYQDWLSRLPQGMYGSYHACSYHYCDKRDYHTGLNIFTSKLKRFV